MENQASNDWFSKPGDSIRARMSRRGVNARQLAAALDGGMDTLRSICNGSMAISADIARSLSQCLGGEAGFWLKRQANFDAAVERAVTNAMASEVEIWLSRVPSPSRKKLPRNIDPDTLREELRTRLVYFNLPRFDSWERQYGSLLGATRFRTSQKLNSTEDAVLIWLRRGEMEAELAETNVWDVDVLKKQIVNIRQLLRISRPTRFLPALQMLLAEAGVALVVSRAPKGCRASGASRMVSPKKAMVLLSFRHRADDQFWFTLFHELGHLILHNAGTFIDEDGESNEALLEQEANNFASACLIPLDRVGEFEGIAPTRRAIIQFSRSIGASPGVVVGQLQHRGIIGHNQMNHLKRRWAWEEIEMASA